jgi:hypothetical protein
MSSGVADAGTRDDRGRSSRSIRAKSGKHWEWRRVKRMLDLEGERRIMEERSSRRWGVDGKNVLCSGPGSGFDNATRREVECHLKVHSKESSLIICVGKK